MTQQVKGYIIETLDANGELKLIWKETAAQEMFVIKTKLDYPPMPFAIGAGNKFGKTIYRYKAKRIVGPKWINIVLLPKDYLYCTYSSNLPLPKPRWESIGATLPIHIGTNFFIEKKDNRLTLYYLNPNQHVAFSIKNQLDLIPQNHDQIEQHAIDYYFRVLKGNSLHSDDSLIDQVIAQSISDMADAQITKHDATTETLDKVSLCLFLNNAHKLLRALKRIPGIEVTGGGRHPYKVTNKKGNRNLTAPIPKHSKEYPPYFAKLVAKELGIDYDILVEAAK